MIETLQQALDAHRSGKIDEACALYSKTIIENPDNADALHLYGMALFRSGNLSLSRRMIRKALSLAPDFPIALYNAANVCLAADRSDEALGLLRKAVVCDPSLVQAQFSYSSLLIELERLDAACAQLKLALCHRPGESSLWLKLCAVHFKRRREAATEHAALIAERLVPEDPAPPALRGRLRMEAGNFEEAWRLLSIAAERAPSDLLVHSHLAQAEALSGRKRQALERSWRTTNLAFVGQPKVLRDPLSAEEILDRIDAAIPPDIPKEDSLVYPFNRVGLIGHTWVEPSYLRTMFLERYRHIVLFGPPLRKSPRVNPEMFDIAMQGLTYVETEDLPVTTLSSADIGEFERDGRTYLLSGQRPLERRFGQHLADGGVRRPAVIPDKVRERGEAFCRRLGIPLDAPVVVLHMREPGYHPQCANLFSVRDVTVANYLDSIRFLKKQGYFVVRLGDSSMTPLPDFGAGVLDAAFIPDHDRLVDVYFISRCAFMISCGSGLEEIVRAVGRPNLVMNLSMVHNIFASSPCDLFAFRRCIDLRKRGRHVMTFEEMIDRGVPDAYVAERVEQKEIMFEELTAQEMLAITREMTKLVDMRAPSTESTGRFRELSRGAHERRSADPSLIAINSDFFSHGVAKPLLSDEFLFFNDNFLDK